MARSPRPSAAGATCARAPSTSASPSGWPSARARARSRACCSSAGCTGAMATASTRRCCRSSRWSLLSSWPSRVLGRASVRRAARAPHRAARRAAAKAGAVGIGLVLGFVLGMTSVGSGALVGLALIIVFRLTPHRVVGHRRLPRRADAVGRRPRAPAGRQRRPRPDGQHPRRLAARACGSAAALLPRVPALALRFALGCVLLGSALGVLSKAGVDIPSGRSSPSRRWSG